MDRNDALHRLLAQGRPGRADRLHHQADDLLVVLDGKLPMDEIIEVNNEDRAHTKGNFSRLAVGTKLTRADLMHLALMSSENRAAYAPGP